MYLNAHRLAISLSGGIWMHLEASMWLFRVAELFSYYFQMILHFANVSPTEASPSPAATATATVTTSPTSPALRTQN
jgi:hypothetical protein